MHRIVKRKHRRFLAKKKVTFSTLSRMPEFPLYFENSQKKTITLVCALTALPLLTSTAIYSSRATGEEWGWVVFGRCWVGLLEGWENQGLGGAGPGWGWEVVVGARKAFEPCEAA